MSQRLAVVAALLAVVLAGCQLRANPIGQGLSRLGDLVHPAAAQAHPAAQTPVARIVSWLPAASGPTGSEPYLLDSGDRLRIVVFGEDNLSRSYSVDGSGYISMPLIGAVPARGLTTFDLERRIADLLKQKYVKDPKVSVEVETYRPFFILGEVRKPGQYAYVNGMTVETAVAIAGGYTERAKERSAQITRRMGGRAVTFAVPPSYAVRPGDTIKVPERFF